MVLKLIEPKVIFFTPGNVTIDSLDIFPSVALKYTFMVNEVIKCLKIPASILPLK